MTELNESSQIINLINSNKPKYKNVKITENVNGKAIKIGQGGFGKVYKVVKSVDKCELNNGNITTKDIVPFAQKHTHIFERDGNLIGQNLKEISLGYIYMNHENLQNFQSIIVEEKECYNSKYFINMLLADMSMDGLIKKNLSKDIKILFFLHILKQLIRGLSYIHANFISHGDIKPENILIHGDKSLLNENDISEYLKSATFKITDYSGLNIEYNNTMDNTSTLHYKAPELFVKMDKKFKKSLKETYGPYNDIWSIGITMLEFLTGNNLISKLYKKSMKIREKDFLIRFFNCMKSLDISMVLKNNGYDINNYHIKNIINILELMLVKKIHERINIYNLSIFINYFIVKDKNIYLDDNFKNDKIFSKIPLFNNVIEYTDNIVKKNINMELRNIAINVLRDFMKIDEYNDPNDKQYLPLSISLFDRLISKNIKVENNSDNTINNFNQFMYNKTLLECYYIASRYLLNDIDILFISDFLNIDIDIIHIDILEIIKQLDFDIYRPTVLTFLNNQDKDIYHSEYIINTAINNYCDCSKIKTDYVLSTNYISEFIENDISRIKNILIDNEMDNQNPDNIDFSECNKPSLKREDYFFNNNNYTHSNIDDILYD